jgi:hypothetical protein
MAFADLPPETPETAKLPAAAPTPPDPASRPSVSEAKVRRAARHREATVTDWLRRLSPRGSGGRFTRSG